MEQDLITYEDKVALDEQPSVADINKVKDTDMNQIKNVINGINNGSQPLNNLVVDNIRSKNLFNIFGNVNIKGNDGTKGSINTIPLNGEYLYTGVNLSNTSAYGQKFTNLNGKKITFSAKVTAIGTGTAGTIVIFDNNVTKQNARGVVGERISLTYTCTSDNIVCAFGTTGGYGAQFTDIQVEINDEVTSYTPYIPLNELDNVKVLYKNRGGAAVTSTYTFPDTQGLYAVIAMTNGDNKAIIDLFFLPGPYTSRIFSDSMNYTKVTYSGQTVTIKSTYAYQVCILKLV